jgi:hypothetical protein
MLPSPCTPTPDLVSRRAKAKTLEGKGKLGFRGSPTSGGDSPPDTPPDFGTPLDVDLQTLIHEDERESAVCIPVTCVLVQAM